MLSAKQAKTTESILGHISGVCAAQQETPLLGGILHRLLLPSMATPFTNIHNAVNGIAYIAHNYCS